MTIEIRAQRPDDDAAVSRLLAEAFEDAGQVAEVAVALRARVDRGGALVAVEPSQGNVVGLVQLSVSWVDAPERLVEVLVLSPLAVAPAYQRQGVGTSLLAAARSEAERLGSPLLFLEGDPSYYSRRGWRPAGDFGFSAPSLRIPGPVFQVLPLRGYDPTVMRGAVVYNDTFWSHDCVGLRGARLNRWANATADDRADQ